MEKKGQAEESIINAHKFSSKHRNSILKSKVCGCFYCLAIFPPSEIVEWVDEDSNDIGQTALCPKCGIDSVLGDSDVQNLTKDFLQKMKGYWF